MPGQLQQLTKKLSGEGLKMNKQQRIEASELIKNTVCIMERFEVRLSCGMTVRCKNNKEARASMAAKFLKGPKLPPNAANLLKRKLYR